VNDKLKNKKKVYIFGTNTPGSMILSYLKANGVEVCGFLDNDITKENKSYRGVYVYTPERILKYYDKNLKRLYSRSNLTKENKLIVSKLRV
jgi:FlaA1/EpsC-like NDP-sugar epimerase